MKMKKLFSCVLVIVMLMMALPMTSHAEATDFFTENVEKYKSYDLTYENTTGISDAQFFGVWENGEWTSAPYFDYNAVGGLGEVEAAAKAGDYETCKEAIMEYYKGKLPGYPIEIKDRTGSATHKMLAELIAYNMYRVKNPIGRLNLRTGAQWFDLDCASNMASSAGENGTGEMTIGITALEKDGYTARFASRESGDKAPYILAVVNGVEKKYTPVADTTVAAGNNKGTNYGSEPWLYAEESVSTIDSTFKFDDYTQKTMLKFSFPDISPEDEISAARFYIYGDYVKSQNPVLGESQIDTKYAYAYLSGEKGWEEDSYCWRNIKTSEAISFDREKGATAVTPSGLEDVTLWRQQIHNSNNEMEAMLSLYAFTGNEDYAYTLIRHFMDIAEKTYDISEPYFNGCSLLNTGLRARNFHMAMCKLINSQYMTPEIFTTLLKFYWNQMEFMATNWNRAVERINHGIVSISYCAPTALCFNEFCRANEPIEGKKEEGIDGENIGEAYYYGGWIKTLFKRAEVMAGIAINPDGSLIDIPFSYMYYSLDYFINLPRTCAQYGYDVNEYFSDAYWDRIDKAIEFTIAKLSPKLGSWQVGDELYWTNAASVSGYLSNYLVAKPDSAYATYVTSGRKEGKELPYTTFYNDTMKVAVLRPSWDENAVALYINADDGETHGHADDLSACVFGYGNYLLTDGLSHSYDQNNPYNIWAESTKAHNTIEVNSTTQLSRKSYSYNSATDILGEEVHFAKGQSRGSEGRGDLHPEDRDTNAVYDYIRAETKAYTDHNGLNSDFKEWRSVLFVKPGYFIVTDYVEPQNKNAYNILSGAARASVNLTAEEGAEADKLTDGKNEANSAMRAAYQSDTPCVMTFDLDDVYDMDTVTINEICGADYDQTCGENVVIEIGTTKDGATEWKTVLPYGRLRTGFKESAGYYKEGEVVTTEFLLKATETGDKIRITLSQDSGAQLPYVISEVEALGVKHSENTPLQDINTYKQNWHFLPDAAISLDENNNTTTHFDGKANIIVAPVDQNDQMKASLEDGYSWLGNATAVDGIPTKGSRYTKRQTGTVSFNTVLYPVRPGETAQISTENIELDVDPSAANAFCAKVNDSAVGNKTLTYYTVLKESERKNRSVGSYQSDASVFFVEQGESGFETLVLKNGTSLKEEGAADLIYSKSNVRDLGVRFNSSTNTIEINCAATVNLDDLTVFAGHMKKVSTVTVNGAEMPFCQSGRYIYFGDSPVIDDSGYEKPEEPKPSAPSGGGHGSGGSGGNGGSNGVGSPILSGKPNIPSHPDISEPTQPKPYADELKNHWGKAEIEAMIEKGVVQGDGSSLHLLDNVTRGEFVAMLLRSKQIEEAAYTGRFADVAAGAWYAGYMEKAYQLGILNGDGTGNARPDDTITREEMAKIIVALVAPEAKSVEKVAIADLSEVSAWAVESVEKAITLGLMNGVGEGRFNPKQSAKREEAIVVLYRMIAAEQ